MPPGGMFVPTHLGRGMSRGGRGMVMQVTINILGLTDFASTNSNSLRWFSYFPYFLPKFAMESIEFPPHKMHIFILDLGSRFSTFIHSSLISGKVHYLFKFQILLILHLVLA